MAAPAQNILVVHSEASVAGLLTDYYAHLECHAGPSGRRRVGRPGSGGEVVTAHRQTVLVISGSPSKTSRTERMAETLAGRLAGATRQVSHLCLRTLPPGPLLAADTVDAVISDAVRAVGQADGIVLATPTYKAAYSGLLKVFLDLLPRCAFADKAVLPVATGGSLAHVLTLDYALRPVVQSLGARHVVQGFFVLEGHLVVSGEQLDIHPESHAGLETVLEQFCSALDAGRKLD